MGENTPTNAGGPSRPLSDSVAVNPLAGLIDRWPYLPSSLGDRCPLLQPFRLAKAEIPVQAVLQRGIHYRTEGSA